MPRFLFMVLCVFSSTSYFRFSLHLIFFLHFELYRFFFFYTSLFIFFPHNKQSSIHWSYRLVESSLLEEMNFFVQMELYVKVILILVFDNSCISAVNSAFSPPFCICFYCWFLCLRQTGLSFPIDEKKAKILLNHTFLPQSLRSLPVIEHRQRFFFDSDWTRQLELFCKNCQRAKIIITF